jgi:hypothetical protein
MTNKLEEWRKLANDNEMIRSFHLDEACDLIEAQRRDYYLAMQRFKKLEQCLFQAQNAAIDLVKQCDAAIAIQEIERRRNDAWAEKYAAMLKASDELAVAVDLSGVYKDCQDIRDKLRAFRALLYPGVYKV